MTRKRTYEQILTAGLIALLLLVGGLTFRRAVFERFDFYHFYLDARYVWEHGALNPDLDNENEELRRQLPFYLPAVSLLLAPITAWGHVPAALVWSAAQVAALGYSLLVLRRWGAVHHPRAGPTIAFAAAMLLAIPALLEASKFNQLSFLILALVLGGARALECRHPLRAGGLLAVAAVFKLLPGLFLPWLLLKRQWAAAISFVVVGMVVALVPSLIGFGPHRTIEYHRQWWDYNRIGATGRLNADLQTHFIDHRNQSISVVLARLTSFEHPCRVPWQPVQMRPATAAWLGTGISTVLLLVLLWLTRRPWVALTRSRRHAEAAVYAVGLLVFSPLLRQYYLVWALPALLLLSRLAIGIDAQRTHRVGLIGLGVWAAGMLAWLSPTARLYGANLLMLLVIAGLLLATTHPRERRWRTG